MKERPIIFSAESVQAILEGRKTQTRRVVKEQPNRVRYNNIVYKGKYGWEDEHGRRLLNLYGAPGDRLWVREKWRIVWWGEDPYKIEYADGTILSEPGDSSDYDNDAYARLTEQCSKDCDNARLEVDGEGYYILMDGVIPTRWRSPIYMPRWASRIMLEITNVRVERIQEMSPIDTVAEGVYHPQLNYGIAEGPYAIATFANYWDSLNEKRGYPWSSNPWVWVIEFKRI